MITNKEAFKKGRKAYNDGEPKSSNPYPKEDNNKLKTPNRDFISWNEGYDYVKNNNLKENTMSKFEQYLAEAKVQQKIKSAKTSLNQVAGTFPELERLGVIQDGMIIADIGGGAYDKGIEWAEARGAKLHVIDPFNRDLAYNKNSMKQTFGKADIATVNNVLNVIAEPEVRRNVLARAKRNVKEGGAVYVKIYPGEGHGNGRVTKAHKDKTTGEEYQECWQEHRKTSTYEEEVKAVFGNAKVMGKDIIMAVKNK
jgi:hypothetical protein